MKSSTPRERMLTALNNEVTKYVPCSFMLYKGLHQKSADYLDFLQKQLDLGLEPYAMIPPRAPVEVNDHYNLHGMAVKIDPSVKIEEWIESRQDESCPIMVKEYRTPAGTLRTEVRQTEDWRWGDHIPLFDDYISPRTLNYIIKDSKDLEALKYLLVAPSTEEIESVRNEASQTIQFAHQQNLLTVGGWGIGADMLGWIYGFTNMVYSTFEQPEFLQNTLNLIADWNSARMQVLLEMGIDLYIKRTWYETCNFWSPKSFRKFLLPILKKDVETAHQAGVKFGCIATDRVMPLLPLFIEAGVDVLIGIDPHTYDLAKTKEILGRKVCLWGGVNGHLTVELGSEADVRKEVGIAMKELGRDGGFILSPVDNVREDTDQSRKNVSALIDEWKKINPST
jgi:uroporphyrinogen-III decarboxylase